MKISFAAVCVATALSVWQASEAKTKQEEIVKLLRAERGQAAIREQELQEATQNVGDRVLFLFSVV